MKIYALKWVQSGRISSVEAYLDREQAQRNADRNNLKLGKSLLQKLLGRYWIVVSIYVREPDDIFDCMESDMRRGGF